MVRVEPVQVEGVHNQKRVEPVQVEGVHNQKRVEPVECDEEYQLVQQN